MKGRVGYLAKMFPRVSETFILREVEALRDHGIPVRVYSLLPATRDRRLQPRAAALAEETIVLPQPGWSRLPQLLSEVRRCLRARPLATSREALRLAVRPTRHNARRFLRGVALARRMREDRITHLHAAWAHTPASVARIASELTGIPWSMGAHAKDIYLSEPRSLVRKLSSARFTTACSRAGRDYLASLVPSGGTDRPAPSVLFHPHGVDGRFFSPGRPTRAAGGAAALVLSVGRLVEKKGFDTLIDAVARLRDQGHVLRLEIVGEGPLREALTRRIRTRGLENTVTLRGMLVHDEIRELYRRAACVVLASRVAQDGDRDGIPNTLAEAMAVGIPVVATRQPGIVELVTHGENGLLVPADDPDRLASAIAELLGDPGLRSRLGAAGRARIEREFDAIACARHIGERFSTVTGIENVLYLSADRGVPVSGSKGASVHVRAIAAAFRALGKNVRILSVRPGREDGPRLSTPVVETGAGPGARRFLARVAAVLRGGRALERALVRLADNVYIYRDTMRQALAFHPDLLYERYALTALAGSFAARRLRIPHVVEVNAPLAEEEARYRDLRLGAIARRAERVLLRRADIVVVVSNALRDHVLGLGVRPERVLVLPNAVDPAVFHPARDGRSVRAQHGLDGDFVVGFSGTLKPWHGCDHLLRAFADVRRRVPGSRLLVLGDGPGRDDLRKQASELGLEEEVLFVGHVNHESVGDHLAACDVLVAPYGPIENHWFSPLKVAEYLAVGRPVVASAVGQLLELGGEARGMILVPPGDEAALGSAITRLAQDQARRLELGRLAAESTTWTWTELASVILDAAETARRRIWGWEQ